MDEVELKGKRRFRPDACIGPDTNCSRVRVCSHGFISSSHALTSDWRADDMDCITPSTRDLIYGVSFFFVIDDDLTV